MDLNNPVVKLCAAGTQAEFQGRIDDACRLYWQAWEGAASAYERCIAAHYLARCQDDPHQALHWNLEALTAADEAGAGAAGTEDVCTFYPSLYVNLGISYEALGDQGEAQRYYQLAAALGLVHHAD